MALLKSSILTSSIRNLSILTSCGCRSATRASRQLSYVIHSEKQPHVRRNLQPLTSLQSEATKHRKNIHILWSIQIRNYAKSKNIQKKGANKHKPEHNVDLSSETVHDIVDFDKYQKDMQKVLEDLKKDYMHKLSVKTTTGSFDRLQVDTEDGTFPLNQIASIIQKNPTLIILNLNQYIKYAPDVMETMRKSGMNLNLQQEGKGTIYITIVKVSHEHREELARNAKTFCNQAKVYMNQIYSAHMRKVNKVKTFDVKKSIENRLLQEKTRFHTEAESVMKVKQKELLGS